MRAMLVPQWPHQLEYRGEGNQSLVIALTEERVVLRLLKSKDRFPSAQELLDQLQTNIRFSERVLPRLLPPLFFRAPQLVQLDAQQLAAVRALSDQRPAFRRVKSIASAQTSFGLLLPDYCCLPRGLARDLSLVGPLVAIEIKPKQGFLPHARLLKDELRVKARVCRYGLNQFHKLQKGAISTRSRYCPLDLFSGCPARQTRALRALLDSPQNNLRVFRERRYAFGDQSGIAALDDVIAELLPIGSRDATESRDLFLSLLVAALNKPFCRAPPLAADLRAQTCHLHGGHTCACSTAHASLEAGSVLGAVLAAQRLDLIDSEKARDLFVGLQSNNNEEEEESWHARLSGDWLPLTFGEERAPHESESDFCMRQVWQFLVSLTAKDCSLMLALQQLDPQHVTRAPEDHVVRVAGRAFLVAVRVTDLDQKAPSKIARTLRNDRRMVRALRESALAVVAPSD